MTHRLTACERAQYDRDGFLYRKNVFSAAEVAAMGRAIESVCRDLVARKDRDGKKVLYTYQPAGLRTQLENTRLWAQTQRSNSPSRS